jgi:hypothetical protein
MISRSGENLQGDEPGVSVNISVDNPGNFSLGGNFAFILPI